MTDRVYNDAVVDAADATIKEAIEGLLEEEGAVIGIAPAGAGKSHAIGTAVAAARRVGLRVAVATPTNEQAYALVASLASRLPSETVTFVPSSSAALSGRIANAVEKKAKFTANDWLLVGTLNKFGDAFARGDLRPADVLLIDEAYQANAVHYYMVGDLAPRHLLMGDSGQLAPFSTAPDADRWRGLDEDPLLTAVGVLKRNHTNTPEYRLPITRRLDPRAVPVVRAFYPGHSFEAAVLPGVRRLDLGPPPTGKRRSRTVDAVLDAASLRGWAHVELPDAAVVAADPDAIQVISDIVERLFSRAPRVRCENQRRPRSLRPEDVAVAVSHNDQKDLVRAALDAAGLGAVVVNTANKLQGLTYEVVVAWHPLAGLQDIDEFHLDPGRLCVMLTRHRQACIVVGRAADRRLVEGIPPATPSYMGWDDNPALEGWYVHEALFSALEPHRIALTP